ncbi:MAG: hypothetical protein WBL74_04865 [Novosphingobium sp.]|uniref:hypothetical protein n=1 Tax=Novosphingobium sp. TaxID=1874826 RepID=UPI003C7D218B
MTNRILKLSAALLLAAPFASLAEEQLPPSAARSGGFTTVQLTTTDPEAMVKAWAEPTPEARVEVQNTTKRNQPIHTFVAFAGCKPDAAGACHVVARFVISDPQGKPYDETSGVHLLDGSPPPSGNFYMSASSLGLTVENGEPLGAYTIRVETTDQVAGITVQTEEKVTVEELPLVGGWQPVANPNKAAELRGPVKAMLATIKLITGKAKLAVIEKAEKQIVAGTNYHLRLRLKDGRRWSAKVWHKLDGSDTVTDVVQLK